MGGLRSVFRESTSFTRLRATTGRGGGPSVQPPAHGRVVAAAPGIERRRCTQRPTHWTVESEYARKCAQRPTFWTVGRT